MAVGNLLMPYGPVMPAPPWRTAALSAPAWWASVLPWWSLASSAPPCVGISSALAGLCFICSALPCLDSCSAFLSCPPPVQPMRCLSSGLCCYWSIWKPLLLGVWGGWVLSQSPIEPPLHYISQHPSCHSPALPCQSLTPGIYQWILLTYRR